MVAREVGATTPAQRRLLRRLLPPARATLSLPATEMVEHRPPREVDVSRSSGSEAFGGSRRTASAARIESRKPARRTTAHPSAN
ncbi:hypothetical protein GE061_004580 [Apolygus lucorum]|uniref:Uncharacterized protein n=1 Tax=Apolygus lucorum TaxID=248454 RepID=A0A8S9WZK6_APOLU|nr:hypothetical protein GE061_004580 [Apolygus lucorum]